MPHAAKSKFASGNRNWRANAWPSIATDRLVCRAVPAKGAGGARGQDHETVRFWQGPRQIECARPRRRIPQGGAHGCAGARTVATPGTLIA